MVQIVPYTDDQNIRNFEDTIIYPGSVFMRHFIPNYQGEKIEKIIPIEVSLDEVRPEMKFDNDALSYIIGRDLIAEFSKGKLESVEVAEIKKSLKTWIAEKATEHQLEFTEESEQILINLFMMLMKSTDDYLLMK